MRIATIGAGKMARALGAKWVEAGHEVYIGARRPAEGSRVGTEIGARGGTIDDGLPDAEVVLLAVPGRTAPVVAQGAAARGSLDGKIVIDCTNALGYDAFTAPPDSFVLATTAVAEAVAEAVPSTRVVKAFNILAAEVWTTPTRQFDGQDTLVPVCGNDKNAVRLVSGLVADAGAQAIRAGDLARARYAEATAAFVMGLWFAGHDARAMLPPLDAMTGAD
ncbi:NADPH-dependent F420 reductase [Phytoactinopolyspora limicola]|uniref:NADPH-dependent F420 reductase n=1 Tax=Phytoactinopolyspora limicola TaxID=2715536 RepID=UPI00140E31B7|nr:NAD(P)-binding domain-containing protein [Phytoactinopolyspora limicola]